MKEKEDKVIIYHDDDGSSFKIVDGKKVYLLEPEPKPEDIFKKESVAGISGLLGLSAFSGDLSTFLTSFWSEILSIIFR